MSEQQVQTLAELGAHLRQTRELKDLDRKDLAAELRLLEIHLIEIESGEYAHIKSAVFAKGYMRKYAQRLGLDVDQIMAWFDQASGELQQVEPYRRHQASSWPVGTGVALVAVVIMVLGVGIWAVFGSSSSDDATATTEGPAVLMNQPPDDGALPGGSDADLPLSETVVAADGGDEGESANAASDESQLGSVEGPIVEAALLEATQDEDDQLELRFSGDCWVEVRDSNRKLLVADLKKKGDVVSLHGVAPYEILVGYAPAVEVSYQGRQIPVVSPAGQVKAQMTVGG